MAILEKFSEFCDNETLSATAGSFYFEGSSLDLGKAAPGDIGAGAPVYLVITVATGITAASAGSIRFYLASDDAASLNGSGSTKHAAVVWATSTTAIPAGTVLMSQVLPETGRDYERYLGIVTEVLTANLTAGAINAYLTCSPPKHYAYPDGAPALS